MKEKTYTLSESSDQERADFMKDLDALCIKHMLNLDVVPQFVSAETIGQYSIKGVLLIRKMTEEVISESTEKA